MLKVKWYHYIFALSTLIAFALIYLMPHEWAKSAFALALVDRVADIVPVIEWLRAHVPPYTPFWGFYYSVMWCLAVVHFLAACFFLSRPITDFQREFVLSITGKQLFSYTLFLTAMTIVWANFPWLGAYSIQPSDERVSVQQIQSTFVILWIGVFDGGWVRIILLRIELFLKGVKNGHNK